MNNITDSKSTVKKLLLNEGFDEVGFASVNFNDNAEEHLAEWLKLGYHGSMSWIERNADKRIDITKIMPEARTVIVCLQNYFTNGHYSNNTGEGKISRYAWGDDYHEVLGEELKRVVLSFSALFPDEKFIHYVDTGPVMEKVWAVEAGLGWQGKNSLLLNKKLGTYCFIGVIITSVEITPDSALGDYCGSCTACMSACPTQALVQPAVLDARRCISYWTIEVKPEFEIPVHISEKMNHWLFGCDICQDVCPWNKKIKPTFRAEFMPREGITELSLYELSDLDEDDFRIRFYNSPIKRAKLNGMKRNARALADSH